MQPPLFERKSSDTTSTLVKLKGNPLNYVIMLQTRVYEKTQRQVSKGDAVSMLLNTIPKEIVEKAIKKIVEEKLAESGK